MSRLKKNRLDLDGIEDHPAYMAWCQIKPRASLPKEIETLKNKKQSKVYRLKGIGPENQNIIAKGGRYDTLKTERLFYEKILPDCHFKSLEYFGFIKNKEGTPSWLFMEDAMGVEYNSSNKIHRQVVLDWLSELQNTRLTEKHISLLPDRSLKCYNKYLCQSSVNFLNVLKSPELSKENVELLKSINLTLDRILLGWNYIESLYEPIPLSLVHGDFTPRNFKILDSSSYFSLLPFDWEMGGWGIYAFDFSKYFDPIQNKLDDKWLTMNYFLSLSKAEIKKVIQISALLRLIASVYWVSRNLIGYKHKKSFLAIAFYQNKFSKILAALEW